MKIKKKIFIILITLVLVLLFISNTVFGAAVHWFDLSISTSGADDLKTKGGQVVGIIQIVGTIVAVGMLIVLGIKFVLGSAEEKAAYKKTMLPYFIGAVLIFGFSNITQLIYQWASEL